MKRKALIFGMSLALLLAFTTVSAQAQLEPLIFGMVGAGVGLAASGGNPAGAAIGGAIGFGTGMVASAANAHAGYGYYGDYGYSPGYYRSSYYRPAYVRPVLVVGSDHGPRHHYRSRHHHHHGRDWVRTSPHRDRHNGYHNNRYSRNSTRNDGYRGRHEARVDDRWR